MEDEFKTFTRNVHGHKCENQPEEHILVEYINEGILVEFRRYLKSLFMVNSSHPKAKEIFKSTYRIRKEEERHLEKYYYMIHPFSTFRVHWQTLMMVIYFILLIFSPLLLTHNQSDMFTVSFVLLLDLICGIDMCLFCATGYLDVKQQKVIMRPRSVCIRYLTTYFIFDLLATLPFHSYINFSHSFEQNFEVRLSFSKGLLVMRLARLFTATGYLRDVFERFNLYSYYLKTVILIINFVIICMWSSILYYLCRTLLIAGVVEMHTTAERLAAILISCELTMRRFLFMGAGQPPSHEVQSIIILLICFVIGAIMNFVIFAVIVQICTKHNSATNKYKDMMLQADAYAKYKEMPLPLKSKVFQYIDFKFQKNIYNENLLLSTMSTSMKQEVLLSGSKKLLDKVEFFKDLPQHVIIRIVEKLKSVIYLPNDIIVQAGIVGNAMYFIYVGTVAIYTKSGKEICHLHEGSHFGEIALIINEPRIASVHAVEECELFRLSRRDFQKAIEPFPQVIDKIKSSALGRLKNTMRVMDADEDVVNAIPDHHSDPDPDGDKSYL